MPKRVLTGVVTSDKTSQLRRVEIERLVQHRKYKKIIRRKTVCHVHDENNDSGIGDKVEIIESTPLSRLKRWSLVKVVEKSTAVDLAALRAARRAAETEEDKTIESLSDKPADGDSASHSSAEAGSKA
jgi:small subunit ribosomal protein S17